MEGEMILGQTNTKTLHSTRDRVRRWQETPRKLIGDGGREGFWEKTEENGLGETNRSAGRVADFSPPPNSFPFQNPADVNN
ncbi:unnamed protein product [Linum trigynum]|uniref:Uncharacterized protein n=1 Tax=Linum trigynum TaxID=586398 RepID=A0AAV2DLI5_9ROSI